MSVYKDQIIDQLGLEWVDRADEIDEESLLYSFETGSEDDPIDINGTSLCGQVTSTYRNLVAVFGKHITGDEYKTRAEWTIRFADGLIATIYDWKQYDVALEDVTTWNVGGFDGEAALRVHETLVKRVSLN